MNRPTTAREALIVEALGEVAQLLNRIEAMTPAMDSTRRALVKANADLGDRVNAFESHMSALTENAKQKTVEFVARRTNELAKQSLDVQSQLMSDAARTILSTELGATFRRFSSTLERLVERIEKPWEQWWFYAATVLMTALATCAATAFFYSGEDRTQAAHSRVPPAVASRPSPAPSSGRLVRHSARATFAGASASR